MLDLTIYLLELAAVAVVVALPLGALACRRRERKWRIYRRLHWPTLTNDQALRVAHNRMPRDA